MTQATATAVRWLPRQRRPSAVPGRPRRGGSGAVAVVMLADMVALAVAATATGAAGWAVGGYLLATLGLLAGGGRYQPRITLRLGDELPVLLGYALPPALLLVPTGGVLSVVVAVAAGVAAGRLASYAVLRAARRRGLLAEPVLLVGAGPVGAGIASALTEHPELGLVLYGLVDGRDVPALPQLVAAHRIRRVIVCDPGTPDDALVAVLRQVRGAQIYLVPRLYELGRPGLRDEVWGIPVIRLRVTNSVVNSFALGVKRVLDVVLSGLLLVALAPLLGVLALAARWASGGSALFRQVRVIRPGRVATVLKLRTLTPDPAGDAATDTRWPVPDERCTRLGRLLRTSHADELPQLVNVLRGEMSLVGPRPERPYFAALFEDQFPGYAGRHRMRAGMTGWAQVHGLYGDTSVAERARFDNRYVEDWSLWLDLVILVRTLATVVPRRRGRAGRRAGGAR